MSIKGFLLAMSASCTLLLVCPALYGQATGTISGTLTDASDAAVAGATVTVTAPATGLTRDAKTDDAGHYVIPLLGVATYTVRADLKGFQSTEARDVALRTDEQRELNFKLSPATVQQNVEVMATPVAV